MSGGWFAMKHGVSRHPMLCGRPERVAIWVWLVDNAAWSDVDHDINGTTIIVKRGQVAVSERRLADEVGVGRQVVRTFLKRLTTEGMINPDPTHGKNVITLCNYEKYQAAIKEPNPSPNPPITHDQPIKEQNNNNSLREAEKSASSKTPSAIIFDQGLAILLSGGVADKAARKMLGMWKRDHGEANVLAALSRAQREQPIEPIAFIQGCFKFAAKRAQPQYGDKRINPQGIHQEYDGVGGWVKDHHAQEAAKNGK